MKYAINLQQVSFKTLTMANTCFASLPSSIFNPKSPSPSPSLSIHSKSIKFPSLSLQKGRLNRSIVLSVAQTSDWAHQDEQEGSNAVLEGLEQGADQPELNWNAEDFGAVEGQVSDWEASGGEEAVEGGEGEEEGGFVEPPEEAKLFVGNLPYDVDSERLAQVFEQAGIVEIAEVIYNRETDQSRGFGFVTMSTVEEAEKAVGMFNRYDLNGRILTVNKAAPRGSRPERPPREFEPSFRVYVGNLPWDVDNARLEQVFSEHGKVVSARVVYDRESGRSRGFGFVTMSSETEMNDAISALDGQTLDGRAIRVNMAEDRPRRSF